MPGLARSRTPQRKPRGDYHHGNLRAAMIDSAVMLIATSDEGSFTLREAARRIGVDHRAAYRHFADRGALLAAVADDGFAHLIEAIKLQLGSLGAGAPRRLLGFAQAYVRFAVAEPARYRVMTSPRANNGRSRPADVADAGFALLQHEIASGIARGELHEIDVTEAAIALWSTMHGLADLIVMRRIVVRRDLLASYVDRIIARSLEGLVKG
jgi:AcrR family transcriptional regulator